MLIGEVSKQSGISTRMLRHYDKIGLVSPSKRTLSGYRRYSNDDIQRLFHVEGLRSLGLSLQETMDALDDLTFSPASMVEQLISRIHDRRARDAELLQRLDQVKASDPTTWSQVLRTIELVRGLNANDPSTRQRVALSLSSETSHDIASLAEAALTESDPHVAGALNWALARIGDRAVPVLEEALKSPKTDRRHRAVAALIKISSLRAVAVLTEAIRHPDPAVSGRAALACGSRGEIDAIPELVALIVEGRDDVEAADVLGTLASRYGLADEIARIVASELTDATGAARQRLTSALADIPGPCSAATLKRLVNDPDQRVAFTASFLTQVRHPEV